MVAAAKRSRALAAERIAAGVVVAKEDAARVIQSGIRGALWRRRVKREAEQELVFTGMKPQVTVAGSRGAGFDEGTWLWVQLELPGCLWQVPAQN